METNTQSALANIAIDLRRTFVSRLTVVWLLIVVFPVYWVLSRNALYAYPLSAFGTAMSSPVSLALPLIAVAVYLFRFSREMESRFVVYTRTRRNIVQYLAEKATANAIAVFIVFFLYAAISFIAIVWVAPAAGWLQFDLAGYGIHYASPDEFVRLSELWAVSPALYGLAYAIWCGINGSIWASIGFVALLLVPNRFVALSLPFGACIVLTAALSLLGLDVFSPYPLWILFGYTQSAAWTALAPLGLLAVVGGTLLLVTLRRSPHIDALQ